MVCMSSERFNGDPWMSFWDSYQSAVHLNSELTDDVDKSYLITRPTMPLLALRSHPPTTNRPLRFFASVLATRKSGVWPGVASASEKC